jgi:phospholipid/cholesterol/gamma-HCH transport system permease protein
MWSNIVSMTAAGLYVSADTGISLTAYAINSIDVLTPSDLLHGLGKSALFAILIVIIGAMNGSLVRGGSGGVGLVTTRAVVHASSAIIITDMFFGFIMTQ